MKIKLGPLSDRERQRKRRQKIKALKEDAQYAPEKLIAYAVLNLFRSKKIPQVLYEEIIREAHKYAILTNPSMDIIMQKYVEKRLLSYFNPEGENYERVR